MAASRAETKLADALGRARLPRIWRTAAFLVLSIFLWAQPGRSTQEYRWTDEEGTVHLVDSLEKVPEKYRSRFPAPRPPREEAKEGAASGAKGPSANGNEHDPTVGTALISTPAPPRPRAAADDLQAARESWEPRAWMTRGRGALMALLFFGLGLHCATAFRRKKHSEALRRASDLYERYLTDRNKKDPNLQVILTLEEQMERIRKLVRGARIGTTKLRISEQVPGTGGAISGVIDVVSESFSRSGEVTKAFRSLLRQAAGITRYDAKRSFHPLVLADLAIHLPRHLLTGFGAWRVRSERWMRLVELAYWIFALVCLSVWS